ncbi:MAG: hypothetical protein RLN87_04055 [Parasphingopyxis sp.]|uniref:hypothetical protein n=1 Tax=Parasphingopyxis sp. TaxID=1920299 RepID=UPI0032EFB3F2
MIALAALLLAGSAEHDAAAEVIAAERAFAEAAQTDGQWTAFRRFARGDAVMFAPNVGFASEILDGLSDPPISVRWWPARTFISCDGTMAVNTGPWVRPGNRVGYFVTVWARQADGSWRWTLDDGADLDMPVAAGEQPTVRRAACDGEFRRFRTGAPAGAYIPTHGSSVDQTLRWRWERERGGGSVLTVTMFNGDEFETVIEHRTPAPAR